MKCKILLFLLFQSILLFGVDDSVQSEEDITVFTMNFLPSEVEFNPLYTYSSLEGQIYSALYEGLVSYDPQSLNPVPGMAERWEVLDEGTRYRFYIRPDAFYWNGDKVLSTDFRDAWLKMLELGDEAPFGSLLDPVLNASEYRRGEIRDAQRVGIFAFDDDVLEIQLRYPTSHFLSILAHQSLVAIHPEALNVRDWSTFDSPPGSGPYSILNKSSSKIELGTNENYWDSEHSDFSRIVLNFSDNNKEVTQRFNSGEIQWIYSGFDSSELRVPNSLQISPQFSTSYYFFSASQPPFDDERIRRALLMLLPLSEIRSETVHFFPTSVLIPPFPGYPDQTGIEESDETAALSLLEDAGYPNGDGLPPIRVVFTDNTEYRRVGEIMKSNWEEALNTSVELSYNDYYEYQRILKNKQFTLGTISWIGDYADPMTFLQLWISDSTSNTAGYEDSQFDQLLQESNGLEGLPRYESLAKAEDYLLQSAIVLPVNHSPSLHIIDLEAIGGWYATPLDIHPFKYLYQKKPTPPANIAKLR